VIDIKNILFVFQVFSFFNVIRFRNVQCTAVNGQYGTCYSRQDCTRLGGIASGGCARNWGTCCVSKCASASVCDGVGVGEGTGRPNCFCGHKQCIECRVFFVTGTVLKMWMIDDSETSCHLFTLEQTQDTSVGIVVGYGFDDWGQIPGRGKIFLFSIISRPALWPTQPHIQWIPGAISTGG
jgi:hypothetical protein